MTIMQILAMQSCSQVENCMVISPVFMGVPVFVVYMYFSGNCIFAEDVTFTGVYHPHCARKITKIVVMRAVRYFESEYGTCALFKMGRCL